MKPHETLIENITLLTDEEIESLSNAIKEEIYVRNQQQYFKKRERRMYNILYNIFNNDYRSTTFIESDIELLHELSRKLTEKQFAKYRNVGDTIIIFTKRELHKNGLSFKQENEQ